MVMPFHHATVDTRSRHEMTLGRARFPATDLRPGGWDSQVGQHCPSLWRLPLLRYTFLLPRSSRIPVALTLLCPNSRDHARRRLSSRRRMDQGLPTSPQPSNLQSQTRSRPAWSSSILLLPSCSHQATYETTAMSKVRPRRRGKPTQTPQWRREEQNRLGACKAWSTGSAL